MSLSLSISYGPAPPDSAAILAACVCVFLQSHMALQERDGMSSLGLQIPLSRQGPKILQSQC